MRRTFITDGSYRQNLLHYVASNETYFPSLLEHVHQSKKRVGAFGFYGQKENVSDRDSNTTHRFHLFFLHSTHQGSYTFGNRKEEKHDN